MNAVETLYAAFPALMYIDPSLGGLLLEPLFRLQASSNNVTSSAADLGACRIIINIDMIFRPRAAGINYPSVSGSNSDSNQGVERLYLRRGIWAAFADLPLSQRPGIC